MVSQKKETSLTVVFCTRDEEEAKKNIIPNIVNTAGNCQLTIHCLVNDGDTSLTSAYSSALNDENIEDNVILFIHDDIEFLKDGWGEELLRLFNENKKYGIIGVAGSAEFDEKAAWWGYKKIYGQVLHRHDGKSWLSQFSPLLDKDLEEVCVIDGLFMAIHKKRITESFNEEIPGFNFYDIDFCLANYLDKKCKIGVTTNIRIAHNSIGETKQEWYDNRKIVNDIFSDYYPISVEKSKTYGKRK